MPCRTSRAPASCSAAGSPCGTVRGMDAAPGAYREVFTAILQGLPAAEPLGQLQNFRFLDAAALDEIDPELPELRHLIGIFDVRADRLDVLRLDRRQQRIKPL